MKILLISEFFPTGKDLRFSGGVEARNFFVAKYLSKRHEVTVITSRVIGSKNRERLHNIDVIRVGKPRDYQATAGNIWNRFLFIKDSINLAKKLDIELVEGSNFLTHFIAKRISNIKKIPSIAWYPDVWVGNWVNNAGFTGIFGEILERLNLLLKFDAYIAISAQTADKLKKITGDDIQTIGCGVDKSEFAIKVKKFSKPTVICISRLASYKNVNDLIAAHALLIKKGFDIDLLIVGTGPEKNRLVSLTEDLNLKNHVKFEENLPRRELIKKLKSSHVFCLPSKVEGFGISIIEAAAAGVPYVASDIPVLKEVTSNGQGGLIFRLESTKDLASKLSELINDKKLYFNKVKQAQQLALNFSWEKIAQQTEAVYKQLLSKNTQ